MISDPHHDVGRDCMRKSGVNMRMQPWKNYILRTKYARRIRIWNITESKCKIHALRLDGAASNYMYWTVHGTLLFIGCYMPLFMICAYIKNDRRKHLNHIYTQIYKCMHVLHIHEHEPLWHHIRGGQQIFRSFTHTHTLYIYIYIYMDV
jgi:hypothetical protein